MPIDSRVELITALARETFNDLIGTNEQDWLEFKSAPYRIEEPQQRWELAKDVAALANHKGGCIVIGVKTEKHDFEVADSAVSWSLIDKSLANLDAYRKIVGSWIYPPVRGLELKWFPGDAGKAQGLLLIEVPPQDEGDKLFIIRRMVDEEGRETGAFGIPVRDGADTIWIPAERVHALMQAGKGGPPPPPTPPREEARAIGKEQAEERIERIEVMQEWEDLPTYSIQALPPAGVDVLQGFHAADGPATVLRTPPSIRGTGFNLRLSGDRDLIDGGVVYRSRRVTDWLDPDGFFTAVARADRSFLGWAINDHRDETAGTWINPLTLVEFTLECFRFVDLHLLPRAPGKWTMRVSCRRFQSGRIQLDGGPLRRPFFTSADQNFVSSDSYAKTFSGNGVPGRDAFRALSLVYLYFGLSEDSIPYAQDGAIQEDEVRRQGG